MSFLRPALNLYLKLAERPFLENAQDPQRLRRSFETKAKVFFRPPFGAQRTEMTLAGRPALRVSCGPEDGTVLLYFHGGAYVFGSPRTHWAMMARLCKLTGATAILPDYRKAPEHQHPAALEDALAVYLALMGAGTAPERIVLGGDSAGGGLSLALLADLLKRDLPVPGGCFAFSPLTDLTYSGSSMRSNATSDVVLPVSRIDDMTALFLGEQDPRDPRASPLFAVFEGAPPVWITASDTEILRDDSRRMAEHLRRAGVAVTYAENAGLPHVWPIFQTFLPEARASLSELATWIKATGHPQSES